MYSDIDSCIYDIVTCCHDCEGCDYGLIECKKCGEKITYEERLEGKDHYCDPEEINKMGTIKDVVISITTTISDNQVLDTLTNLGDTIPYPDLKEVSAAVLDNIPTGEGPKVKVYYELIVKIDTSAVKKTIFELLKVVENISDFTFDIVEDESCPPKEE